MSNNEHDLLHDITFGEIMKDINPDLQELCCGSGTYILTFTDQPKIRVPWESVQELCTQIILTDIECD